jgi:hypothetical protein
MTILQNLDRFRLLRAWRNRGEAWELDDVLPIIAFGIDPNDLEPLCITLGSTYPLEDTVALHSAKEPPRDLDWATALIGTDGQVISAHGMVYQSPESFLAALVERDKNLAARNAKPKKNRE